MAAFDGGPLRPHSILWAPQIDEESVGVAVIPANDTGEFRTQLKPKPDARYLHVPDPSARQPPPGRPPNHSRAAIERCLDEIAVADFDDQGSRRAERPGVSQQKPRH